MPGTMLGGLHVSYQPCKAESEGAFGGPFHKGTNSIHEDPTLMT